jgi:hypothetical protein
MFSEAAGRWKIRDKNLSANRKRGEPLGPLPTMSWHVLAFLVQFRHSNVFMFTRLNNEDATEHLKPLRFFSFLALLQPYYF